jgi:hypothetical protein
MVKFTAVMEIVGSKIPHARGGTTWLKSTGCSTASGGDIG